MVEIDTTLLLTTKVSGGKLAAKITRSGFHAIMVSTKSLKCCGCRRKLAAISGGGGGEISAAGQQVEIKQMLEGNGRTYLSISGALD
jgi:hypothetical protein